MTTEAEKILVVAEFLGDDKTDEQAVRLMDQAIEMLDFRN
jgi:hypothetical protein